MAAFLGFAQAHWRIFADAIRAEDGLGGRVRKEGGVRGKSREEREERGWILGQTAAARHPKAVCSGSKAGGSRH